MPAAPVTDEEVAKVLLTKYQSLCPSTSPMELEREINMWRHRWADIDDKPQTAISALNNLFKLQIMADRFTFAVSIPTSVSTNYN